jgi:hypothetical protein
MEKIINSYKTFVEKPEGRPRHRREDNIRVNLKRDRMGNSGLNSCGSG